MFFCRIFFLFLATGSIGDCFGVLVSRPGIRRRRRESDDNETPSQTQTLFQRIHQEVRELTDFCRPVLTRVVTMDQDKIVWYLWRIIRHKRMVVI